MNSCDNDILCGREDRCKRPGYAYVPVQRIGKLYTPQEALKRGTVFCDLDIDLEEYERGLWNGK